MDMIGTVKTRNAKTTPFEILMSFYHHFPCKDTSLGH